MPRLQTVGCFMQQAIAAQYVIVLRVCVTAQIL